MCVCVCVCVCGRDGSSPAVSYQQRKVCSGLLGCCERSAPAEAQREECEEMERSEVEGENEEEVEGGRTIEDREMETWISR